MSSGEGGLGLGYVRVVVVVDAGGGVVELVGQVMVMVVATLAQVVG